MARQVCHVATAADAGKRLDALLAEHGLYVSRSAAARAADEGRVLVGGQPRPKKHLVVAGDAIVAELDEPGEQLPVAGEPIDLDVRYEDDDLLVLSKQAGLVCHPTPEHRSGTLVNALLWHCGEGNLCNVQGEDDRLGIVHRLDRDTTGLMLAAKTDEAGRALMEAIRLRAVDRHYLALVHGVVAADTGMIDAPIARAVDERTRMAVRDGAGSREAITTFNVLERFEGGPCDDGYTLLDCKLFTGRTHQIRVHMQYAKHPLVGDGSYTAGAPRDPRASLGLERQFLHSYRIGLDHPLTGERLELADNLPTDLARALGTLAERSRGRTEAGDATARLLAGSPRPSVEGDPT